MMKNIIFIAPPAAGKGTISDYLVKTYGYHHLSTGDLLRAEIKTGSELGREIEALISKGNFVSDELIIELVESKLKNELNGKHFILDGFPRNLVQAKKLDQMLLNMGVTNNVAIYLDVTLEEATKRAVGRIICPVCNRSYNEYFKDAQPKVNGLCDDCKVALEKRSDDTKETFAVRFQTFLDNTFPIVDYYREQGILQEINSMDPKEEIMKDIFTIINSEDVSVKRRKSD